MFRYTDINKTVPATGTKNIYTLNYIAGLVGCAISGRSDAELTEFDTPELIEAAVAKLSDWLNRFFRYCPDTAALVAQDKLTVADVAQFKKSSLLSLSVGLEVLGHLIYLGNATPQQLATSIDWSKTGSLWDDVIGRSVGNSSEIRVKVVKSETARQLAIAALRSFNQK